MFIREFLNLSERDEWINFIRVVDDLFEGEEVVSKQDVIDMKNKAGIYARNGNDENFWLVEAGVSPVYLSMWKASKDPKIELLFRKPDPELWDFIELEVKR